VRRSGSDGVLAASGRSSISSAFEFELSRGNFTRFCEDPVELTKFIRTNSIPRLFQLSSGSLYLVVTPAFVERFVLPLRSSVRTALLVEQNFRSLVFNSVQTRSHLTLSDKSSVPVVEVDGGFEVHEVLAVGHGLGLLEVRAVREAVDLVLRVLRVLRHPHRRVHFHIRCFQLVVNLVHVLFKPSNVMTSDDFLVDRKDDLGKLVLGLFLESSAENDFRQSVGVRDVHTRSVGDDGEGVVKRRAEGSIRGVVVRVTIV